MNQIEALQRIRRLGVPGFETRDVAALLRVSPANASMVLSVSLAADLSAGSRADDGLPTTTRSPNVWPSSSPPRIPPTCPSNRRYSGMA